MHSKSFNERFWSKVDVRDDESCWVWTAARLVAGGYGAFGVNRHIVERAHRMAYYLVKGDIPKGIHVLHKCDNPPCCNPNHLFLGTDKDNVDDMFRKGRSNTAKGEKAACAILTEKQVIEIRELGKTLSARKLSKIYGIAHQNIRRILNNKSWKHLLNWQDT